LYVRAFAFLLLCASPLCAGSFLCVFIINCVDTIICCVSAVSL
jgi:hypothetical protein